MKNLRSRLLIPALDRGIAFADVCFTLTSDDLPILTIACRMNYHNTNVALPALAFKTS
jgi:hypothetical protein